MKILERIIFHWLYAAPLLYTPVDWAMCVGQLALLKWCIDTLRGGTDAKTRRSNKNRL